MYLAELESLPSGVAQSEVATFTETPVCRPFGGSGYYSSAGTSPGGCSPEVLALTIKVRLGEPTLREKMTPPLEVRNLCVSYAARNGQFWPALAGVSFALKGGEILGVLGESGSGKSTLAAALVNVLPPAGHIEQGSILFEGRNLLEVPPRDMESVRGNRIALIFQEPSLALHPMIRVGEQINAVLQAHQKGDRREREERVKDMVAAVFPEDADSISKRYPHQLSGGQRGRVLIAQAICCSPSVIVADEPTASLDPETQQEIIALFRRLQRVLNIALIWITHSPVTLADFADRIMVLYAGQVVEIGPADRLLGAPQHPYTRALLRCLPPVWDECAANRKGMLRVVPGEPPTHAWAASQCSFEPRCDERMAVCTARAPQMIQLESRHEVSCFRYDSQIVR